MSGDDCAGYSDLAGGTVGAIRVPNIASPGLCSDVLRAMREVRFDWYDRSRVFPPIARFGPTLNDFKTHDVLRPDYWTTMVETVAHCKAVPSLVELQTIALARLRELLSTPIRSASINGRAVYYGTVREMPDGARAHFDDVATEFAKNPFDQRLLRQLAFVVYLSAPRSGGETVIWERGPTAEDENSRVGYGYHDDVVANLAFIKFRPLVGHGLLFRCDRLHAVTPSRAGRRVSMNFFVGVTAAQTAIVWS